MKDNMKISLIQMDSNGTREENENKALKYMEQALIQKTDIICLSESFIYWGKEYEQRCCTLKDLEKYQKFAKENKVNLILGSVKLLDKTTDKNTDKTTNTCFVIDRKGNIVHKYDKKYMYKVNKDDLVVDESQKTIARKNKWNF